MAMELSPVQIGEIASSAYVLRLSSDLSLAEDAVPHVSEAFNVGAGTRLVGVTGVGVQSRTGFGYTAWGQGARQGECLITVRGTVSAYDWLTNLRFGGVIGPSGYLVHAGFWRGA